ncbi:flagellar biosynthetic protein FliR [Oxalobacteraceae bacterium CAVE-383]|nr:flagellar biosynthetic protein FliR [Oxalobacteraceae bacterium CAVE-383]
MISVTSAQLLSWIAAFIWPLSRVLGLISIAPPFSNGQVPMRVKLMLGIFISVLITPNVPALPAMDPMSLPGLLIVVQQIIIGVAMGTVMRMMFAAAEMAGQIVSMTMGLGFAAFFDPMSQGQTAAISQVFSLLATLVFLAVNGHLVVISILADSFVTLPISAQPMSTEGIRHVIDSCMAIFSMGLQLSMPIVGVLLVTNMALGVLSRAAPQLNLFGIGFPITLATGFVMIAISLPYMLTPMERLFNNSYQMVQLIGATPNADARAPMQPARPSPAR